MAERSKAVAQGAIPKGRGFVPHRRHFAIVSSLRVIVSLPPSYSFGFFALLWPAHLLSLTAETGDTKKRNQKDEAFIEREGERNKGGRNIVTKKVYVNLTQQVYAHVCHVLGLPGQRWAEIQHTNLTPRRTTNHTDDTT